MCSIWAQRHICTLMYIVRIFDMSCLVHSFASWRTHQNLSQYWNILSFRAADKAFLDLSACGTKHSSVLNMLGIENFASSHFFARSS